MANSTNTASHSEDRSKKSSQREKKPNNTNRGRGEGGGRGGDGGGRGGRGRGRRGQQKSKAESKNGKETQVKSSGEKEEEARIRPAVPPPSPAVAAVPSPAAAAPPQQEAHQEKSSIPPAKKGKQKQINYRPTPPPPATAGSRGKPTPIEQKNSEEKKKDGAGPPAARGGGRRSGRGHKKTPQERTKVQVPQIDLQERKDLPSPLSSEDVAPKNLAVAVAVEALVEDEQTFRHHQENTDPEKQIVDVSSSEQVDMSVSEISEKNKMSPPVVNLDTAISTTSPFESKPSNEAIENNPYLSMVTKKIRAIKKKLSKIASLENKLPEELNQDQNELLKSRDRLEYVLADLELMKVQFTEIAQMTPSLAISEVQTATVSVTAPPIEEPPAAEQEAQKNNNSTLRRGRREKQGRNKSTEKDNIHRLLKLLLVVARADKGTLPPHIDLFGKSLLGFVEGSNLTFNAALELSCAQAAKYLDGSSTELQPGIPYRDLQLAIEKEAANLGADQMN
eukprot:CAMPEP_0197324088 /NCGR_PEP_ID=MMETSP0891-20130614/70902_1 /TAXON_ID=44058 ORGANISM="Aureoumbra lagunensis, Strain CCMP1510" /NCGR_SAMPLE_ID=MMETSP0891 /ASSEMBLY_ACC=CAM_ASM_000534 /LENGTH=505 /DNA_ID=CAMNT_0042816845 /DNA_START=26 /DNA_END=1543 /DNA_ORIENTATION=+